MTKILLVEDNEMNKDMLSRRLIKKGYDIVFAMDGQEAIDMAVSESPDVILMDMGLPVKDGMQATKEIKENVFAFCGIGNPKSYFKTLHQLNIKLNILKNIILPLN